MRQMLIDLVSDAFQIIGDLTDAVTVTYVTGVGAYNPTNDTQAEVTNSRAVQAVFSRFENNEIDDTVVVETDMKVLIPAKDVNMQEPDDEDYIVDPQGVKWNVQKSKGVPGKSLFIVHVRRA